MKVNVLSLYFTQLRSSEEMLLVIGSTKRWQGRVIWTLSPSASSSRIVLVEEDAQSRTFLFSEDAKWISNTESSDNLNVFGAFRVWFVSYDIPFPELSIRGLGATSGALYSRGSPCAISEQYLMNITRDRYWKWKQERKRHQLKSYILQNEREAIICLQVETFDFNGSKVLVH